MNCPARADKRMGKALSEPIDGYRGMTPACVLVWVGRRWGGSFPVRGRVGLCEVFLTHRKSTTEEGSQTIRRMQPAIAKPLGSGARLLYDWTNSWASSNRASGHNLCYRRI